MLDTGSVDSPIIHSTTAFSFNPTGSLTYTPNGNILSASPFGVVRHVLTATGAKVDKICHLGEYDQVVTCIRSHPRESIAAAAIYGSTQSSIAIINTDTMTHSYDIPWPSVLGEQSGLCFSHDASFLAVTTRSPAAIYFIIFEQDTHAIVASVEGLLPENTPLSPQYFVADPTSLLSDEPSFIVEVGMACLHISLKKRFNYQKDDLSQLTSSYTCTAQYVTNMTGANSVDFAPFYTYHYLTGGFPDSSISLSAIIRHPDAPRRNTLADNIFTRFISDTLSGVVTRSGYSFTNMTLTQCLAAETCVTFKELTRRINIPLIIPKNVPAPRFGVSAIKGIVGGTIYVLLRSGLLCSFYISSTEKRSTELDDLSSDTDEDYEGNTDPTSLAQKRDVRFDAMDRPVEVRKPPQREGGTIELQTSTQAGYVNVALNFSACVLLNADLVLCDSGKNGSVSSLFSRASSMVDEISSWSEHRSNITFCSMTIDRTDLTTIACVVYDPVTGSAYPVYMSLPQVNNRMALQCVMRPIYTPFISLFGYVHINTLSTATLYLRQVAQTFSLMSKQASLIGSESPASSRTQLTMDLFGETSVTTDPVAGFEMDSLVQLFGHSALAPFLSNNGKLSTRITLVDASCAFSTKRFAIATSDGIVRLYEYGDKTISVVAAIKIIDTISSISCHPMGNIIAVASTDSVRILITNSDSLVLEYELPIKLSTSVRFNTSGGILSVLKGNIVSLYDTWTKHCIGTLEGHNDVIVDICRLPNKIYKDVFFVTAARDGMLHLWDKAGVRVSEIIGRIRFTSLSPYIPPIAEFGKYPPVLACGNGCLHICDFNSNLVLFTGYYEEDIDQNVTCLRDVLYDDYRDIVYASDIDGRIHSLLLPDDLKDRCLKIIENSKTGMVGADLQPEPTQLRPAEMKLPDVRFATATTMIEANLQATFGVGMLASTYRSGVNPGDRQQISSSTSRRKMPLSVPSSSDTQRQIEPLSEESDTEKPLESSQPRKHLMGKVSRSLEEIQKLKLPLIVKLSLSPDHKYLLATSINQTGCFSLVLLPGPYKPCIYRKFRELASDIGVFKNEEAGFLDLDILVDESYLQVLRKILLTLLDRTKEAELEFEHTVRIVTQRHEKAAEAEKSLSAQELESAKQRTDLLVDNAEREAEQYEAELHSLDRMHSAALEKLEAQYRVKVQNSHEKHEKLKADLEISQTYLADTLAELMKQRDNRLETTMAAYNKEEEAIRKKLSKLDSDRQQLRKEYQELLRQSDEDADVQLQELQSRYNAQLEELYARTNSVSAETGMIKNKFQTIEKSILTYQGSVAACENTLHNLQQTSNSLKTEIQLARAEAEARNEAIVSREKLIYSLKKEAKDLEKHRFVLDFKIKELRKCIEPRETEISDLKEQIREISNELENFHKAAAVLENVIQGHKDESSELKNNLLHLKSNNQVLRNKLMHLEHDVHDLTDVHGSLPLGTLKEKCRALFDQYGGFDVIDADAAAAANERERHQKYLVEAINMLTRELQHSKDATITENARIVEENAELLKEAAVLRREIQKILHGPITQQNTENSKVFAARLTAQEAEIKRLKKKIVELQNAGD